MEGNELKGRMEGRGRKWKDGEEKMEGNGRWVLERSEWKDRKEMGGRKWVVGTGRQRMEGNEWKGKDGN